MSNVKLYDQWRAMDDKHLGKSPISLRLPVHVLARVNAISALFPTKTRTDIVTDLLKAGLDAFEESLPPLYYSDSPVEVEPGLVVVEPVGATADYRRAANHNYEMLEQELGNYAASDLFDVNCKPYKG